LQDYDTTDKESLKKINNWR